MLCLVVVSHPLLSVTESWMEEKKHGVAGAKNWLSRFVSSLGPMLEMGYNVYSLQFIGGGSFLFGMTGPLESMMK